MKSAKNMTVVSQSVYSCNFCSGSFGVESDLQHHVKCCHSDRLLEEISVLGFLGPVKLEFPEGTALLALSLPFKTVEAPYDCEICLRTFAQKYYLKKHVLRKHADTTALPYECVTCGRSFKERYLLNRHTKTHSVNAYAHNVLPYQCHVCRRSFAQRYYLTKHVQRMHSSDPGLSVHMCDGCSMVFENSQELSRHIETDSVYICYVCRKNYCDSTSLRKHLTVHFRKQNLSLQVRKTCATIIGRLLINFMLFIKREKVWVGVGGLIGTYSIKVEIVLKLISKVFQIGFI